jgi:hypothetical protein
MSMEGVTPAPTNPADEQTGDYDAYCAFIEGEGLVPVSHQDWLAFNRALDAQDPRPAPPR